MRAALPEINALVKGVRADGYTHALLLGMGGSSLAPEVFRMTFGVAPGYLNLDVLDSTDPGAVRAYAEALNPVTTLFIVSTKSGGTVETLSFFKTFYNLTMKVVGKEQVGDHFIAITDPGSSLVKLAEQYNFRATFLNDPNIGGRYSALSYFGLVPAGLIGVDLPELLERASAAAALCGPDTLLEQNPGTWIGAVMGELAKRGRDKLTFIASTQLDSFGDWVEQLIAESTGKDGIGILPVAHEPLGKPGQYGEDRLFVHLQFADDNTHHAGLMALTAAGHPLITLTLEDQYDLAAQFFIWEMATAVAGHRMGIQPFDQPDVEAAKNLARAMVQSYTDTGKLPEGETMPLTPETLSAFLDQAQAGDYLTVQAFIKPADDHSAALDSFRLALRNATRLATTSGYGPRYLHSTGQLHKGDGGTGLFIQFIAESHPDLPIPDAAGEEASSMTFGVLKKAQALGDAQALIAEGRRIIRFNLGSSVIAGLQTLIRAFQ
jgi:glucose-6-phosphate isomerase